MDLETLRTERRVLAHRNRRIIHNNDGDDSRYLDGKTAAIPRRSATVGELGDLTAGDPNPGHRVAQVFFMEPQTAVFAESCLAAQPATFCDYFVDITDTAELKVKALDRMRSQQYGGDYARRTVEVLNGRNGHYMRVAHAEGFARHWPEIGDYLTVSRERLDRANEPESTMHSRTDRLLAPFVELPRD